MKHYFALFLAAVVLALAAPCAFATRVIFDPPTTPASNTTIGCTQNTPCNIGALDTSYQVGFISCKDVLGVATGSNTWCLWLNNVTLHAASTFSFAFTVPTGGSLSGDTLDCESIPSGLATNNCPQALPSPGNVFNVSFFVNPALPNRTDFYLFTDFVNSPGSATVTVAVPEPGELGLFGLGLLALGLGVAWRRRYAAKGHVEA